MAGTLRAHRSNRARKRGDRRSGQFGSAEETIEGFGEIGDVVDEPSPETVAFKGLPKGVSVDASLESRAWGSDVSLHVRGFRPGTLCTVWLRRSDGTKVPAGSFRYVYAGESDEAQLSSGLDPPDVKAIGLRAGSRTFVAPISSNAQGSGPARS